MAIVPAADVNRQPMSWSEFLARPDSDRVEYSEGLAIMNPPPTFAHQEICLRTRDALMAGLGPDAVVAVATGWVNARISWTRIPDLMLLTGAPAGEDIVTSPPIVVVEVLSTNRRDDLVIKWVEYHREGAGQYWIVDPRDRVIDVYTRASTTWRHVTRLSDDAPSAILYTSVGDMTLRITDIFR